MSLPGFFPITAKEFRGLLKLPKSTSIPQQFAVDCQNVSFIPGGFLSRPGTAQKFTMGGGTDVFHFEILLWSSGRYYLSLMDGPELFYSKDAATRVSLKSGLASTINHFRQATFGTRTFFTFSNSNQGQTAPFVWTSHGSSNFFDPATEAAPAVGSFAAADGAAGSVTAGVHKLVVIYETRSGYQTSPSGEISFTADGSSVASLTDIPVGGATITKRHIGMTEADAATFYLLGTISNNVDDSATFDIPDATLIQQTLLNDWFQFKHPLPNFIGVIQYDDRMVYWGGDSGAPSLLWISEKGLPATVRADLGFLTVGEEDGDRITNCFVLGSVLYIVKTRAIYALTDNGADPFNWGEPSLKCNWMGTVSPSGVAVTSDKQEVFILDVKGIYRFMGGDPQLLSQGIEGDEESNAPFFDEVNYANMNRSEIHIDPLKKRVYAWVPIRPATTPDRAWIADYREGLDRVKWAPWVTAGTAWRSFAVDSAEVLVAEAGPIVSRISDGSNDPADDDVVHADRGTAIEWYYEPGVLRQRDDGVQLMGGLRVEATGAGDLDITIKDKNGTTMVTPAVFALSATPVADFFRRLDERNERFFVRLGQNNAAAYAQISSFTAYLKNSGVRGY